jgi:hypothetical protein
MPTWEVLKKFNLEKMWFRDKTAVAFGDDVSEN